MPVTAYIINLDRSPDRWAAMCEECEKNDIIPIRVPAVDGKLWDGSGWKKQGRAKEMYWRGMAGCYFSHIKALNMAISAGQWPCLILEDDVIFDSVPKPCGAGMEWMGGFKTGDDIYGLHAICYNTEDAAKSFVAFLQSRKNTSDSVANIYRKTYPERTTVSYPFTIHQRSGTSLISGEHMNREAQSRK
jgi:hypothetical protein